MHNPIISVLMTAYNRQEFIAGAIESVLNSSCQNLELIIVDDNSADGTVDIIKKYVSTDPRVKLYINETNIGDYLNRNKAASLARGKYLKYLDSDDYIYPFSLDIMVANMEANPSAAYGFSYREIQKNTQPFPVLYTPRQAYYEHFLQRGFFYAGPGSAIVRRDVFETQHGFSGKRYVGDFELWLNLSKKYDCIVFQPSLMWWRIHKGQEFDLGNSRGNYILANYLTIKIALLDSDCPLETSEIKKAVIVQTTLFCRNTLILAMKEFKTAINIYQKSGVGCFDILKSCIPLKWRLRIPVSK